MADREDREFMKSFSKHLFQAYQGDLPLERIEAFLAKEGVDAQIHNTLNEFRSKGVEGENLEVSRVYKRVMSALEAQAGGPLQEEISGTLTKKESREQEKLQVREVELQKKLAEHEQRIRKLENVVPQLQAEVVKGASAGRAKLTAQEAAFFESPETKRVLAVQATGKQVKELADNLRKAGYEITIPPQTAHPELPRGVRDKETPIYPLEEKSYRHVSPQEEQTRNTELTMMVVRAPGSNTSYQIMNNSEGQLTMTKLDKGESFRLPTVSAPNPPGANVYSDPQKLQTSLQDLSGVQKRERAKI